jgi:hypothetical protein
MRNSERYRKMLASTLNRLFAQLSGTETVFDPGMGLVIGSILMKSV